MKFGEVLIASAILITNLNVLPAFAHSGKDTVERLVQTFTSWNGSPTDRQFYDDAAKFIDYHGMAQRSLSSTEWNKLTAPQRRDYTNTLRTLVEERYYTRWHRIFNKGKLDYISETNSGSDIIVKSKLVLGKKVDLLDWQLDSEGADHKVISLAVGQSDLLKKLSSRLQGRLTKSGFTELLTWMKDKASVGPDNSDDAVAASR